MLRHVLLVLTMLSATLFAGGTSADTAGPLSIPPRDGWQSTMLTDHPLVGRIWLPGEKRFGTVENLRALARSADYLLLGEKHTNADHHRLQADLLGERLATGARPGLVWEMLTTDQSGLLQTYLSSDGATAAGFGPAVGWSDSGWPDWTIYQPIAETALPAGLPQAAGNLPRDVSRSIVMSGADALPSTMLRQVIDQTRWDAADRAALAQEMVEGHCNMLPESMVPGMSLVQRARDGAMALAMVQAATADGTVLIAGGGHTRLDRGVPRYLEVLLQDQQPAPTVVAIAMMEVEPDETDPAAYVAQLSTDSDNVVPLSDAIIFTPRLDLNDPCEKLRLRHGKQ